MDENDTGKKEKTFHHFGKKIDDFMAELSEAGERLQKEFHLKYEELKQSAEKVKNESGNKERWNEIEERLKKAGEELSKAFEAAFKKRGK